MKRLARAGVALVEGTWFGAGVFLAFVAAPAAFALAPTREIAGNIVGGMLSRWHILALAAPLMLLAVEWRRWALSRTFRVIALVVALLLASAQVAVDVKVRAMRHGSRIPISELAPESPQRRTFGMLHGVSMLLMVLQIVCAGGILGAREQALPPSTSREQ